MNKAFFAAVWVSGLALFGASRAPAAVAITPATGGTNISADKAANASSPAWTTLGQIIIDEVSNPNRSNFGSGSGVTLVLKAPAGFEFNTAVTPSISFISARDITSATITVTDSTTITITLTVSGTSNVDRLTIGATTGIQVRPTLGNPVESGQIFRPASGGGTAVISGITTSSSSDGTGGSNFGSLSEVVGAISKLTFTTQPGAATTGAIFGQQPVVTIQDQFGNSFPSGLPASLNVTVALTSGTGPLLGTTTLDIGTGAGSGVVNYTDLQIDVAGTNKQLTASASGVSNGVSAVYTVNAQPTISDTGSQTINENTPTAALPFTIGDADTPLASLILSASSSNTNLVPNANILFGGSGSNRTVTITPATNQFGTVTITITVSDGSLSASDSFLLTVNPVNDAPVISTIANQIINEDTSSSAIGFTVTDPETPAVNLTLSASSSNTNLVPNANILLGGSGTNRTVTLTPLANQSGTTTITISASDGTNTGTRPFLLTVNPVNDAPTLNALTNVTVSLNPGPQNVSLSGITSGATNETQILTVTATSGNTNLIPNPAIAYTSPNSTGTLTFTPLTNASGSAVITVTVQDDGGTANGGVNTFSRQFTVTVTSIADLAITQIAAPSPAFVGGNITLTVTVTNQGPSTAAGITVTNFLPLNSSFVSAAASQGTCANIDGYVACSLGSLTNRAAATVAIVVTPATAGTITNIASVTTSTLETNPTNNSSSLTVSVIAQTNFIFTGAALVAESCANGFIDSAEMVTVNFALRNIGTANTTNLVATLKTAGGVTSPGGPQTYGVLTAGGASVARPFSFIPIGSCGGTVTATLQLQDGTVSLGAITNIITLGTTVTNVASFALANAITLPTSGTPAIYPSVITVTNLRGPILKATVTLNSVTHNQPDDVDILLVSPGGQRVMLMSDAGGISTINNATLTIDDAAAAGLPDSAQIVSGTYRPTDFQATDTLPSPAPGRPYSATLSVFNNTNPLGDWKLFINDDANNVFSGNIAGGWTLTLTTLEPVCCIDSGSADLTINVSAAPDPVIVGNNLVYTLTVMNRGPATASGVTVTNPLPLNSVFVSVTSSQGTCTNIGGIISCSFGTLASNAVATATITVQPTLPGLITNLTQVVANQPDSDPSNNVAAVIATVDVPTVSIINDASVIEGNTGTTNAVFTVQLSSTSSQLITVDYATTAGTAAAGSDYFSTNGTLIFNPGQTNKTIVVLVKGDVINEASEYFTVNLSTPVNVTIDLGQGLGTISDDDPMPVLVINDMSVIEGNSGTTNAVFIVSLAPVSGQVVQSGYATTNGTALAGSDYFATNGIVTFNAGETNKTIVVAIIGDTTNELNESFSFSLAGVVNATIADNQGVGTIINDDFLATITAQGATVSAENCGPTNGVIDPNETVTVNFSLRNVSSGTANTTNLVATLLQAGGVVSPGGSQNYGVLTAGGAPVSRPFTFTANGGCGGTIIAVLQLQDGAANLGMVTNAITMGVPTTTSATFSNPGFITIPGSGPAAPYPSTITVSGLSNFITKVTVTLTNLNHTYPDDLDILLVGPAGQVAMLMSDVGLGTALTNVTLTFDDGAASALPDAAQIVPGTFRPTDFETGDVLGLPAPPGPYGTNLSFFNGTNPNGTWSLYGFDDTGGDAGNIAGGWSVTVTTPSVPICCGSNSLADLTVSKIDAPDPVVVGNNLTYTITVTNRGPNAAVDATLTDTLPSGVSFVSATNTLGGFTYFGGAITCSLGNMANGARGTITITVTATNAGSLTNIATVSSRTPDPISANNTATAVTTVLPAVSIVATDATASEAGSSTGIFTVSRTDGTVGALTVFYTVGGTATSGDDYASLSGSVTVSNGATSATITVTPVDDFQVEPGETVVATLTSNPNYFINPPTNTATVTIQDNDVQSLVVAAAAQPLRITSMQRSGNNVIVSFMTVAGNLYRVERIDDITGTVWTTVADNIPGTGSIMQVTDVGGGAQPKRFYRVRQLTFASMISVPEGGTNSFTVRLAAQPTNNVTVTTARTGGDTNLTVSAGTPLTFTPANWNVPQLAIISASSDLDADNGQATFTASSAGLSDQTVNAIELDNDLQSLIVSVASLNVLEGGSNTFTVRLNAQPITNTTVTTARTSGDTNLTVAVGANLTFNATNWTIPQTVTLAASEDDADLVNGQATFTISSAGMTNATLIAIEVDNDLLNLVVSESTLTIPEGSTNSFTIRLSGQPTNDVSVTTTRSSGDKSLSVLSGTNLIFNAANWDIPQPVVLAAAEDPDAVNGQATFTISAPGVASQTLLVTEADNDVMNLVVNTLKGPRITSLQLNGTNVIISFDSLTNNLYRVERADDIIQTNVPIIQEREAVTNVTFTTTSSVPSVGEYGWTFYTRSNITVTALGYTLIPGNVTPHRISLWNTNGCTPIAQLTVDPRDFLTNNAFRYMRLPSHLLLPAGNTYAITIYMHGGDPDVYWNASAAVEQPEIVIARGLSANNFCTGFAPWADLVVGVPNFLFEAGQSPGTVVGNLWTTVADNVPGTGEIVQVTDVGGAGQPRRFYRINLLTLTGAGPVAVAEGSTNTFTVRLGAEPTNDVTVTTARATGGDPNLTVSAGATLTFTTNDWNLPQTVVIAAAEDIDAVNGQATFVVSAAGLTNQTVVATEIDNDTQFLIVSTNSISVPEGTTNFFTVRLSAQPTNDVAVTTVRASGDPDLTVDGGATLTFTTNNWNAPQNVGIVAADDLDAVNGQATFTVSSAGLTNQTITAAEVENDTQFLIVSTNSISVPEGTTNFFTVRLNAQPTNDVTVTTARASGDPDLTVDGGATLTFTTNNWNVPQNVGIVAADDLDAVNGQAAFTMSSAGLTNVTVTAIEVENDVQFIVVSTNSIFVPEGTTNFFAVRLNAQPTNDVTVTTARASGDLDLTVDGGATLTFTTNNWNVPQNVGIVAADDLDAVNGQATFTVSSAGLTNVTVTATEVENDVQFIIVSTNSIFVPEGGTNTFTVQLSAQPTNSVVVTNSFSSGDTNLSVASGTNLTFTPANWNVPQTVAIRSTEDFDAVNGQATFTVSSAGLTNVTVTTTEIENDTQFIIVSTNAISVLEGGTNTFTVQLNAQPTNNVTVTTVRTTGDTDLGVASGTNLTFTPINWNVPQTVAIRAAEDFDTVNGQATFAVSSAGLTNQTVIATEIDNDTQFIIVSTNSLAVPEGTTNFFTVRLNAQPTNDVTVTTARASGDPDLTVDGGAILTFTTNNWNVPQNVGIVAADDLDAVNGQATFTVSSAGLTNVTVTATEVENDVQFIVVSTNSIFVPEGTTNFFTVRLNAQPTNNVTVTTARASGDLDLTVDGGATLTFTTNNWNVPQNVGIVAADDLDAVNGQATFTVSSAGLTNVTVTATEIENDVQFIIVSTNSIFVPEGGTNTFTVQLSAQPTNNVTVTTARTAGDTNLSVASGANLTFTTVNWNVPQTVAIRAAEDLDAVNGAATFTVSSAGLTNVTVTATEIENDVQFIVVSTNSISVPEGSTNFFTVQLNAQPTNNVTVTTTRDAGSDTNLSVTAGATLTFTTVNWNVAQRVVISAAMDADAVNNQATFTVSSAGLTNQIVTATEADNDVLGIVVSTNSLPVPEGGTNSFTVSLSAQPTNDITITITRTNADPDLTLLTSTNLTFTPANWNVPQPVTVAAAEDPDAVNGQATFTISSPSIASQTLLATEADNDVMNLIVNTLKGPRITSLQLNGTNVIISFDSLTNNLYRVERIDDIAGTVWTTVADNVPGTGGIVQVTDVGGAGQPRRFYRISLLTLTGAGLLAVAEGSTNAFTVRLGAQPTNDVTVTTARATGGDPNLTVGAGATLTFTTNDWNLPQTVVIAAAEDLDAVNGQATFVVSAAGLTNQTVVATEIDNDTQYLIVSTNSISVPEGTTNFFTVRLSAQPINDVAVTTARASGDPDLTVDGGAILTFTTNNWNAPQNVGIVAADDFDAVNGQATFTVSSAGLTNVTVTATEIENDAQFIVVSTNSIFVPEGTTNFFAVRLNAQPTNDVTVTTARASGDPDLTVDGGAILTFTTNNWNDPQNVGIVAADDLDAVNGQAAFTVSSAGLTNVTVTATEIENDAQFIVVSTNSIFVPEGTTNFFTARLNAQPTNDVSVTTARASGDLDLTVDGGATLTFTTNNWNVPQNVGIVAADDLDAVNGQATFTVSSAGLTNVTVTATEVENDVQFIIVSTNSIFVPEGGTNTFTVRLSAQPTNNVTVTTARTAGDTNLSVTSGASLAFNSTNWFVPQPVVLSAAEDFDTVTGQATFTVSSAGLSNVTVTATEVENDVQFIVVSTNSIFVPEGGTNSFTVRLNAQPTNNVIVTNSFASGDTDLSVASSTNLTFTPANWNISQAVAIRAAEDFDTINGQASFIVSSAGLTNVTVTATEVDNDTQFLIVSTNSVSVPEGGTNFFTVRLSAQPTNTVTVTNSFNSGDTNLSVSVGTNLTFNPTNWFVPQTVVISATEDDDAVNGQATFTVSSAGLTTVIVTATEVDNETQFLIVSTNSLSVPEGSTNFFTVRLSAQPINTVIVTNSFSAGDNDLSVTSGDSLSFNSTNWFVPQTVVLSAAEDFDTVNGQATFTVSSAGLSNVTVTATEIDNDTQFLIVSTNSVSVPEGSTNFFTVRLSAQPTNDVIVTTVRANGDADLTVTNGDSLTFNPTNWFVPQSVVLSAAEDVDAFNGSATFTVGSAGLTNVPVTATEVENDALYVIVSTNSVSVPEGSTNTFTMSLSAQPTNSVTVTTAHTSGDTNLSVADGGSLIFTTNDWNVPQPVAISAAEDDDAIDGQATFSASSADLTNVTVTVTEADNDTQFLIVSTNAISVPEGSTNSFTVRLSAEPTNDVVVTTVRADGDADLTVTNGDSLTFNPTNWFVPQSVVLSAAEDVDAFDGSATFTVGSADLTNVTVTATEVENDALYFVVSTNLVNVAEGGAAFLTVRLSAQPTDTVEVTADHTSGDADLSVTAGTTLTFTTNNWNSSQAIVISAAEDDDAVNGQAVFTLSASGFTNQTITATELDNDVQYLIVSTNSISVPEGSTNLFTVRLSAQPTNTVTVTNAFTSGATSLSVTAGGILTFATTNWNVEQTVVITAAPDSNTTNDTAIFTVSSDGLTNQTVTATEIDNGLGGFAAIVEQLRITALHVIGNNIIVNFPTKAGNLYRVERADTLAEDQWTPVADKVIGTGGIVPVTDLGGAGRTSRFYRVRVLP